MVAQVTGGNGIRYTYKVVVSQADKAPALADLITPEALRSQIDKKLNKPAGMQGKKCIN
jgi:hypothetical protein